MTISTRTAWGEISHWLHNLNAGEQSLDDQRWTVEQLLALHEEFGSAGDLPEEMPTPAELQSRLQDIERRETERDQQLTTWAKTAELQMRPLPDRLLREAAAAHLGHCSWRSVSAAIRHAYTNYDRTIAQCPVKDDDGKAYGGTKQVLHERIDELILAAIQTDLHRLADEWLLSHQPTMTNA